ncbi:MAG: signal peptidase II, partial [Alphaproteobacteria bacterium]|nr:signal peptidase II [Alphaproteobacteria bacterium]
AAALGLVIGGALGNVVDRLLWQAVADFFDFHLMGYHWPAFNIADAAIVAGVAGLLMDGLFERREADKQGT